MPTKRELLDERTVKELKQMARDADLSGYSRARKDELIEIVYDGYTKDEIKAWSMEEEEEETEEAEEAEEEVIETEEEPEEETWGPEEETVDVEEEPGKATWESEEDTETVSETEFGEEIEDFPEEEFEAEPEMLDRRVAGAIIILAVAVVVLIILFVMP